MIKKVFINFMMIQMVILLSCVNFVLSFSMDRSIFVDIFWAYSLLLTFTVTPTFLVSVIFTFFQIKELK